MLGLILAGGKGTRLRPLTVYTPKPVVPLVNRPFLQYQIEILKRSGIKDVTLSLSYQPHKIEQIIGDGSEFGVSLRFVTEPHPMGTGGAYRFAAQSIRETTVVMNGDILTDFNIAGMIEFHKQVKADATIAQLRVNDPSGYGLVEIGPEGKVTKFIEKPESDVLGNGGPNTINAGIYVLEPSILDLIPKGENRSFEYHVFPEILARKMAFAAFDLGDGYWRDIGTPSSYLQAHLDFISGRISGFEIKRPLAADVSQTAFIDDTSVIASDCVIKSNARIIGTVLGSGVHVDEKAFIENSVIWQHARISAGAEIRNSIIGRGCYIGKNVVVGKGSVLGDKASLPDYSAV